MFHALTANGRAVSSLDSSIHPPYYCPDCRHEVQLRTARHTRPHFIHTRRAACRRFSGESEEHTKGKTMLAGWLEDQNLSPLIEKQLPEEKRRADVFVHWAAHKVAVEIQRSPIASSVLLKRSRTYAESGILPLWLFTPKLVQQKRTGSWFWNEAVWSSVFSGYLNAVPVLDPFSREMSVVQPSFETSPQRIVAAVSRFPLSAVKLPDLFRPLKPSVMDRKEILMHKHKWRFAPHQFAACKQYWNSLDIYTRQLSHISLHPAVLGWPTPYCYVFQSPPLVWQSLLFYRIIQQKSAALKEMLRWVQKDSMLASLIRPGLRTEVYVYHAVQQFLLWLRDQNVVCFHSGGWHMKSEMLLEASAENGWTEDRSLEKKFAAFLKKGRAEND